MNNQTDDDHLAKKKRIVWLTFILASLVVLTGSYVLHIHNDMADFGVCYRGGQRIIRGETLYREADGHLQFKYSPAAAAFFAPFALLPYDAAKTVWYLLELASLAGLFLLSWRLLPTGSRKAAPVLLLTFLIELKFLARELELGQVNLLILFILTLMVDCLIKGKDGRAGCLWGGSLIFKPYALVFLPYLLLKRRFRALAAGMAIPAAGLILPAIFYGFKGNFVVLKEWPATLSKSTPRLVAVYDNASLYGFLLKTFPEFSRQTAKFFLLAVFLGLAAVVLWLMRAGRTSLSIKNPEILESSFLLILIPLFSPLGWYYNYLYSLLAVMLVVSAWKYFPRAGRIIFLVNLIVIGTSLVELWGRNLFHFYTKYSLVALNFLIVLISLACLRIKDKA
jgi:Glycosyltransferase family 87